LGVGRLVKQKDFPTLIRAFARVRAGRPVHLLLLGRAKNGKKRRRLTDLIDSLGVTADVQLAGYVDNPLAYMKRAAVLVLSSAWEGLPGVLIEALACGCPIVSTDCPSGPSEILDGGKYGRLVPIGDDAAMAAAINATLDAPPARDALRARAEDFSADRAIDRYLAVLLSVSRRP
jgi:glycosyltransferase involved in cell wall biosynthesis